MTDSKNDQPEQMDSAAEAVRGTPEIGATGKNAVTSNAPDRERVPVKEQKIDDRPTHKTPSTSGDKGTEEPGGTDEGPGGTGW